MSKDEAKDIRAELASHKRRDDLARLVRTVAFSAADERRARFSDGLEELLREAELEPEDGVVSSFNVLRALSTKEPPTADGREVLGLLLARGIHLDVDESDKVPDDDAWARIAETLCWLAANTFISGAWAVDEELEDEHARRLWQEMRAIVTRADELGAPKGRGEAMMAAAALGASTSEAAGQACRDLSVGLTDPLFATAFSRPIAADLPVEAKPPASDPAPAKKEAPSTSTELTGEIVPSPLGPIGLVLWAATGLIVVRYFLRFVANVLLRCRRPVEVTVAGAGVTLKSKLDVLGKTVRTRETHIPLANLARASREVRYPRLALYAGLVALSVGTYFGVSLATDGARSGSPSLLALGAGVFAVGVIIDMIFSTLLSNRKGSHRVIFVPRKGRSVAVRIADASAAESALRKLASSAA